MSAQAPSKIVQELESAISSAKSTLKILESQLNQTDPTKQLSSKQRQQVSNLLSANQNRILDLQKQINQVKAFESQSAVLQAAEQKRVTDALAKINPPQVLTASVRDSGKSINERIAILESNKRITGDPIKQFDIQKQINNLRIQQAQIFADAERKRIQAFEVSRKEAIRTSEQAAKSAAIKESEIRAVAASQGVSIGTIEKGAAGNIIANITTPTGEQKKVVVPSTSGELAATPISKLPEATAAGGRVLQVELAETLKLTDEVKEEKRNIVGGIDFNINVDETLGFSDVKEAKPVDKITAAIASQAKPIPKEDIAKTDFFVDISSGEIKSQVTLTPEAQKAQLDSLTKGIAQSQLFFATPTDLALGKASILEPVVQKKKVTIKAGEQPTSEQLKGATSIVQLGTGGGISKASTKPFTTFFDNITNQIKSFTRQQEIVAKTSDNVIERGLAGLGVGIGRLTQFGFSTSPVGIALKGASLIEQGEKAGLPKKFLESSQDSLFNIITVQKQIAEKSNNPIERGLANIAAFGAGIGEQLASDTAFGINILKGIQREGQRTSISSSGFNLSNVLTPSDQDIRVSETLSNIAASKGIEGLIESRGFLASSDPFDKLAQSFGPAGEAIGKTIQERGLAAGLGSIAGILLPFNPKAVFPIRSAVVNLGQGALVKTTQLGFKTKSINLFTQFGGDASKGTIKNLISKTGDIKIGGPLRNIEKIGIENIGEQLGGTRGLQLSTLEGLGLQVARDPRVQQKIVREGILGPRDIRAFQKFDELAAAIQETKTLNIGRQIKKLSEDEPLVESLLAGSESRVGAKFIKEVPADVGGGFAQNLLVFGSRPTGDLDIPFQTLFREEQRAAKAGEKFASELNIAAKAELSTQIAANPNFIPREFILSTAQRGPKVFSRGGPEAQIAKDVERIGGSEKTGQKVAEILTEKDLPVGTQGSSSGQALEKVFGFEALKGRQKIELPFNLGKTKVESIQTLAFKKLASSVSIQKLGITDETPVGSDISFLKGTKTKISENILPTSEKGGRIGPPDFRLKDLADLLGENQIVGTLAKLSREKGNTKLAIRLEGLQQDLRKLFPEVDLDAFGKADVTTFVSKGTSTASKAASSLGKITNVPFTPAQAGKGFINTKDVFDDIKGKTKKDQLFVFHTTSSKKAKEILDNPKTFFNEGKIFFTALTKSDAERLAANRGKGAVTLKITLNEDVTAIRTRGDIVRDASGKFIPTGKNNIDFNLDEVTFDSGSVIKKIERATGRDNAITEIKQIQNFKNVKGVRESLIRQGVEDLFNSLTTKKPKTSISNSLSKALNNIDSSITGPSKTTTSLAKDLQGFARIGKGDTFLQSTTSGKQPSTKSIGSSSLLKNLDSIGSLGSAVPSQKSSLGLPSKQSFGSIGSIKSPSVSALPSSSITGPSTSPTPSGSPSKSPSGSPSKSPSGSPSKSPSGSPSVASLVFGKATIAKPPFIAEPPFLINLLAQKESERKKKLPTFTKALTFIADPADPLRAGVFAAKGVGQLVSGKADVFKIIDKKLAVARQAKGAFVPLGENIGIEKARIGLGPKKKKRISKKVKAQRALIKKSIQRKGLI